VRFDEFLRRAAERVIFAASTPGMSDFPAHTTSPTRSATSVAGIIARYRPRMEPAYEQIVGDFTRNVVLDSAPTSPDIARDRLATVAQFARWCWQSAALELDRRLLFQPSVIGRFIQAEGRNWKAPRRRRAARTLTTVGNHINATKYRPPAVPHAEALAAPYAASERPWMFSWAATIPREGRRLVGHALLGFCGGAGLTTRELLALTREDLQVDGDRVSVNIRGEHPRTVSVEPEWLGPARYVLERGPQTGLLLYPNWIHNRRGMLAAIGWRSAGDAPRAHRLRNTWIVTQLNRYPVPVVMHLAGIDSIHALARHLPYLDQATAVDVSADGTAR
jgi:integrase